MASETVDPIDWSHPPPYTGQYPLSSTYYTLQCGLQITRLAALSQPRTCDFRMPDQRTAGAATQGMNSLTTFGFRSSEVRLLLLDFDFYGPSPMFPHFLKRTADVIAPRMSVVFLRLIRLGSFPSYWRQANVTQFRNVHRPLL